MRGGGAKWAAAIVLAAFALIAVVRFRAGGRGTVPADLVTFDPARPPSAVGDSLAGADVTSDKVVAPLRAGAAGRYRTLAFHYPNAADAPDRIALEPASDDRSSADAERARLSALVPGGLDPNGQWSFGAVAVSIAKDGTMDLRVDPTVSHSPNPLAHRQLAAGFRVLTSAAFDLPFTVDPNDRKELLGAGYPLADLAELDPTTPVEKSANVVRALFPGAILASDATIAIEHPIVRRAKLSWTEHRPDGTPGQLRDVELTLAPDFASKRAAVEDCIVKKSALPNGVTDDAKTAGSLVLSLGEPGATFQLSSDPPIARLHTRDTFPPTAWATILHALDACP